MNQETYDIIWDKCIEPAANELLGLYGEEFREKNQWFLDDSDITRKSVYKKYTYYRNIVHKELYKGKKFDVHKISSCFTRAIIDISPINVAAKNDLPEFIALSNYWLGLMSGIYIVRFLLYYTYKKNNSDYTNKVLNHKFQYPDTTIGHDYYLTGRVRALAVNDGNDIPFDILGFADMLYWIEHFNRQKIEGKIDVKGMQVLHKKNE